jgi:hypothetical protein
VGAGAVAAGAVAAGTVAAGTVAAGTVAAGTVAGAAPPQAVATNTRTDTRLKSAFRTMSLLLLRE